MYIVKASIENYHRLGVSLKICPLVIRRHKFSTKKANKNSRDWKEHHMSKMAKRRRREFRLFKMQNLFFVKELSSF